MHLLKGPFHDYLYQQHLSMFSNQKSGGGGIFNGHTSLVFTPFTSGVIASLGCNSVLDFGSGSGVDVDEKNPAHVFMRKSCRDLVIHGYEPSMRNSFAEPSGTCPFLLPYADDSYDSIMSFDVIEHLHQLDCALMIPELFRVARFCLVLNISCRPASKLLPNGLNMHTSLFDPSVWLMMLWQESLRTDLPFALFTTYAPHCHYLVHNLPLRSKFCWAFNHSSFSKGKFSTLGGKSLSDASMSAECVWSCTHVENHFQYNS